MFLSVVGMLLLAVIQYVITMIRVLFSSLIIYRGLAGFGEDFYMAMRNAMENLAGIFHMPYISYMLYPFIYIVEHLALLSIDLNGMNVRGVDSPS